MRSFTAVCVLAAAAAFIHYGDQASGSVITIVNNCKRMPIWPAVQPLGNSAALATSGFELMPGEARAITVPRPWSGTFWARSHCGKTSDGHLYCSTGECSTHSAACAGSSGPSAPATLVEMTLGVANRNTRDIYDINLSDGFNLPVLVTPLQGAGRRCQQIGCVDNFNAVCPRELQVRDGMLVLGCLSPCAAFGTAEYCCTGEHSTPATCSPNKYSRFVKSHCPAAFSYPYDANLFTCSRGGDYEITFCPDSTITSVA